jgi:hypothetical protein
MDASYKVHMCAPEPKMKKEEERNGIEITVSALHSCNYGHE